MEYTRRCAHCNSEFKTKTASRLYCCPAHRASAHYHRLKLAMNEPVSPYKLPLPVDVDDLTKREVKKLDDGLVEVRKQTFLGRLFDSWDNRHVLVTTVKPRDLDRYLAAGWRRTTVE